MRASKPGPGAEEEEAEEEGRKTDLTSDNMAEEFQVFKTALDFFYDIVPSMTHALKLK